MVNGDNELILIPNRHAYVHKYCNPMIVALCYVVMIITQLMITYMSKSLISYNVIIILLMAGLVIKQHKVEEDANKIYFITSIGLMPYTNNQNEYLACIWNAVTMEDIVVEATKFRGETYYNVHSATKLGNKYSFELEFLTEEQKDEFMEYFRKNCCSKNYKTIEERQRAVNKFMEQFIDFLTAITIVDAKSKEKKHSKK